MPASSDNSSNPASSIQGVSSESIDWYKVDSPDKFKFLCDAMLLKMFGPSFETFGAKGTDHGIDAACQSDHAGFEGRVVFQYKSVDPRLDGDRGRQRLRKILSAKTKTAKSELEKPGPMGSDHYVIVTNAEVNPQFVKTWEDKALGFNAPYKLHFWDRGRLDQITAQYGPIGIPGFCAAAAAYASPEVSVEDIVLERSPVLGELLGRDVELSLVRQCVSERAPCLLLGIAGVGKTHLMSGAISSAGGLRPVFWFTFRRQLQNLERLGQQLAAFAFAEGILAAKAILSSPLGPLERARLAFRYASQADAIVCLDDIHWAQDDPDCMALLHESLEGAGECSFVMTSRNDIGLSVKLASETQTIHVKGLSLTACGEILTRLQVSPSESILTAIHEWTQGAPRLLQLAATWLRLMKREPCSLRDLMTGAPQGISIDDYVSSEVFRLLSTSQRRLLEAAAILRGPATVPTLGFISGIAEFGKEIEGLKSQLLLAESQTWTAKEDATKPLLSSHPMLKDFVLSRIGPEQEQSLHGRAANYFLFQYATLEGALEAAYHLCAIRAYGPALAVLHGKTLLIISRGHVMALLAIVESVEHSHLAPPEAGWMLWAEASCHHFLGHRKKAKVLFKKQRSLAEKFAMPDYVASAETSLGILAEENGDLEAAQKHHEKALAMAREMGNWELVGNSYNNLAGVCWQLGKLDEAKDFYDKDIALCRKRNDILGEAKTLSNLSTILHNMGKKEEARSAANASLKLRERYGDTTGVGYTLHNLAMLDLSDGKHEDAQSKLERAYSIANQTSSADLRLSCLRGQAKLFEKQKRDKEQIDALTEAFDLASTTSDRPAAGGVASELALLMISRGDNDNAQYWIQKALDEEIAVLGDVQKPASLALAALLASRDKDSETSEALTQDAIRGVRGPEHPLYHMLCGQLFFQRANKKNWQGVEEALALLFRGTPTPLFWRHGLPLVILAGSFFTSETPEPRMSLARIQDLRKSASAELSEGLFATLHVLVAQLQSRLGEAKQALVSIHKAVALAEYGGLALLRGFALVWKGRLLRYELRFEESVDSWRLAVATLRETREPDFLRTALLGLGNTLIDVGDSSAAVMALSEAVELEQVPKDERESANALLSLASALGQKGESEQCSDTLVKIRQLLNQNDWPEVRGRLAFIQGNLASLEGQYEEAVAIHAKAAVDLEGTEEVRLWILALASRAVNSVLLGLPESQTSEYLEAALKAAESKGLLEWFVRTHLRKQRTALYEPLLELFQQGDYARAAEIVSRLEEEGHVEAPELNIHAASLDALGKYEESLSVACEACRIAPNDAICTNTLGIILEHLGRIDEAEAAFTEACALRPDYPLAQSNLGRIKLEQGRTSEALEVLERAAKANPNDEQTTLYLGIAQEAAGNYSAAEKSYKQVTSSPRLGCMASLYLVGLALKSQDYEEARRLAERVLTKLPDLPDAHSVYAQVLEIAGESEKAVEQLMSAAAFACKPEGKAQHLTSAGFLFGKLRRFEEAEKQFRDAVALAPKYARAYHGLGLALCEQEKVKESIEFHETACHLGPGEAEHWWGLAEACQQVGRFESALEALSRCLDIEPDNVDRMISKIGLLGFLDRVDEAGTLIIETSKLMPDHPELLYNWGIYHMVRGEFAEAEGKFEELLQCSRSHESVRGSIGLVRRARRSAEERDRLLTGKDSRSRDDIEYLATLAKADLEISIVIGMSSPKCAKKHRQAARDAITEASSLDTRNASVLAISSLLSWFDGNRVDALCLVKEAATVSPKSIDVAHANLRLTVLQGHLVAGLEMLKMWVAQHPGFLDGFLTDVLCIPMLQLPEFLGFLRELHQHAPLTVYSPYTQVLLGTECKDREEER